GALAIATLPMVAVPLGLHALLHAKPQVLQDVDDRPIVIAGLDLVEQQPADARLLGLVEPVLLEALDREEGALVGDVIAQVRKIYALGAGLDDEGVRVAGFELRAGEHHGSVREK